MTAMHPRPSLLGPALLAALLCLVPVRARAQAEPSGHDDEAFDVMNVLAKNGLHDLTDERWNAYGQFTWISSLKAPFHAAYTNLGGSTNSLTPVTETSFTGTLTLYLGARLWPGAEIYEVPEIIAEKPLSHLAGLGGVIQNFELQKTGARTPSLYNSRVYLRQTIELGGESSVRSSDPMQLGRRLDRRRLVLTAGNFSILDFVDKNSFAGDLRKEFFNMAFLTYAAYDFAADARGYAWGGVAEIYYDDWALRAGRITPPKDPNQLAVDFRIGKYYGDQVELEHSHKVLGNAGAVRVLAYRNRENMGRFADASAAYRSDSTKNAAACTSFNYGSENPTAPDLCWVRRPSVKVGVGINVEQRLGPDVGVFFRGMVSDGQTEVYSFTSTDSSMSFGTIVKGSPWLRPADSAGVGYGQGWISDAHADYLNRGGVDGFIGDGKIDHASEHVVEVFYSYAVASWLSVSLDFQHIWNPAYNADRGPVDIFGARMHAEF